VILLGLTCALVLAACGASKHPQAGSRQALTATVPGATTAGAGRQSATSNLLYIYSSLPLRGAQAPASRQIVDGIELALAQTTEGSHRPHVGAYPIRYVSLSDSGGRRPYAWSPTVTVQRAHQAAANPQTIAYVGDLDSGATQLSLPILNQAGIVQITPGSGYPGLTQAVATPKNITAPDEPRKYYPQQSSRHTLLRLIPNDLVQAAAVADLLDKHLGCRKVGIWQFGSANQDTNALTNAVRASASFYGMEVAPPSSPPPDASLPDLQSYLERQQINCAVLTGTVTPAAITFTKELHDVSVAKIVGTDGFCNRGWASPLKGAAGRAVDPELYCTTPIRALGSYPAQSVAHFRAAFRAKYHRAPGTYAYYGYQAAELVLFAMQGLQTGADHRREVMRALIGGFASSPLGYFYASGDLRNNTYGVDSLASGVPRPYLTLDPPNVLSSPH
jgi:branched-chain amino acid transport system substrate-binding protein